MSVEMRYKILIAEDDRGICKFLNTLLRANQYDVIIAGTGREALEMVSSHCPDCMILDLGLPDMDGNEIIRSVRGWSGMPIVVVSARMVEEDKARALDLGADDYLTKPFGTVELLARIRTAIRHANAPARYGVESGCFTAGEMKIDYGKHRVYVSGKEIALTPKEFRIVALLGRHAGQVVTYQNIMRELWGPMVSDDNKILRVHMASIRRKIEPDISSPRYIFTETGVGYRMAEGD